MNDKLSNLHLLLRVPSFARWPLKVRFFCEDVFQKWLLWSERADGKIRSGIEIALEPKSDEAAAEGASVTFNTRPISKRKPEAVGKGGVEGIDVGYRSVKDHIEKSIFLLTDDETTICSMSHGCSLSLSVM